MLAAASLLLLFGGAAGCGVAQPAPDMRQLVERAFGDQFRLRSGGSFGEENMRLEKVDHGPVEQALQVTYPEGTASGKADTSGSPRGGAQAYLRLRQAPVDALHLRYLVRFPSGFDFVKGGKLPGLYGGAVTSGGHIPDGESGFSTRYMWRRQGAGEVYAYLPSSRQHGTSLGRGSWTWPTGRWACVEQAVQLNTPGRQDGSVQVWLDGHLVLTAQQLVFRTSTSLRIDGVFFSSFFGGGDSSWATPVRQWADFAGFEVGTGRLGCQ